MIVVVDSGVANIGSIVNMLRRVGCPTTVSADPDVVARADKLILPGVGAFDAGMRSLQERGLVPALNDAVRRRHVPILGLCLGMQLFTKGSEEGELPGLGWIDATTRRFRFDTANAGLKVPHMGWNQVDVRQPHPVFNGLAVDARFYFVHSFYVAPADDALVLGLTSHGGPFASAVVDRNIVGVQFHPEKSHKFGMRLFKNFAEA